MVKPYSIYSKQNYRRAFWEIAIVSWVIAAIVVIGLVIYAITIGDYYVALVLLGGGTVVGALFGVISAAKMAPSFLEIRWRRDRHDEELDYLDSLDSYEDHTKGGPST